MKLESWSTTGVKIDKQHALNYKHGVPLMPISIRILQILECQNSTKMGCPHNLVNGRGLKVNTAKHSSEKGEGGSHPPLSHYCV